jgi:hypothetical protein
MAQCWGEVTASPPSPEPLSSDLYHLAILHFGDLILPLSWSRKTRQLRDDNGGHAF